MSAVVKRTAFTPRCAAGWLGFRVTGVGPLPIVVPLLNTPPRNSSEAGKKLFGISSFWLTVRLTPHGDEMLRHPAIDGAGDLRRGLVVPGFNGN
jgi:hypothetical protein